MEQENPDTIRLYRINARYQEMPVRRCEAQYLICRRTTAVLLEETFRISLAYSLQPLHFFNGTFFFFGALINRCIS